MAASEVLAAVGRLTERSAAGPLHRAAAYGRAARGCVATSRSGPARPGRTRQAAGGLRVMEVVRRPETRRLLPLVEQLSQLSHLSLAALASSRDAPLRPSLPDEPPSRPGATPPPTPASTG